MNINSIIPAIKKFFKGCSRFPRHMLHEPLIKITCTVIGGIIGIVLGALYQEKSWREQYNLSMLESDRKQAERIFNEVSCLMDDRYYKTVRLLSAYKQNDSIKIQRYRESLIIQLEEWNSNRHRMQSLIEGYYGPEFCDFFKTRIQHNFATTGNHIIYSGAKTSIDQKILNKNLETLDHNITLFNHMMLTAIKQNKIGRFIENEPSQPQSY